MKEVVGHVERITFSNEETGYTIAHILPESQTETVCIVGHLPGLQPGENVRCFGVWKNHLIYGRQFEVAKFSVEAPATIIGIQKYLSSGLVKGIGKKYAEKIVQKFGVETLNVIDQDPAKLSHIAGIGKKRIEKIVASWDEQKSIRDVMVFLQGHGISPAFAQKIFKFYGKQSVAKVSENPYRLAREIFGIGFKTSDQLAEKLGIEKNSPERIQAAIEFTLFQLSSDGHACFPLQQLLMEVDKITQLSEDLISAQIQPLSEQKQIITTEMVFNGQIHPFVWIKPLYLAEIGIAKELKRIMSQQSELRQIDILKATNWVEETLNIELAENQKKAVQISISEKCHIITGGPGTGKSTITNAILSITKVLTNKILLLAPTGRAAKRMTEITGHKASTIHSALEFDFKARGFKKNQTNPLEHDLIIVDESSMVDTYLMYHLLKAIKDRARVIFVGDIDQLPSVGPGNVLKDIIKSKTVKVTYLTEVFRQAKGSDIITNAHLILKGTFPKLYCGHQSDFFFIENKEPEKLLEDLLKVVVQRIPKKYGFDPLRDIQVLAPMKKGLLGTHNINNALQDLLNNSQVNLYKGSQKFKEGDKIIQLKNDYKKEVYNGDIGIIEKIDSGEQLVSIKIDEKLVDYSFADLNEVSLAYAISVHKFQGSECPCIVLPVHTSHFMMLNRNLLYTAVTRAKKLLILIGCKRAIAIATKKDDVILRYTGLQQALMEII